MSEIRVARLVLVLIVALGFGPSVSGDGISGTGYRFKSIVIDGVHYETDNSLVRSNGQETTIDELMVGHRIYALVDPETLTAIEIDQYDAVVGKIDEVTVIDETLNAYEFQVLEQTVRTRIETVMHTKDDFDFKKGKRVAVGGIRDADGIIWATSVESADGKDGSVLTGLVGAVGDLYFEVAGLRIESPYHLEYVQEGWLEAGAPVLVLGGKLHHGVLEAETVSLVPLELGTLGEDGLLDTTQSWIEGEIDWIDSEAGTMQVNGFEVDIDREMLLLDKRDEIRTFAVDLLQPADSVEVVVVNENGRLAAVKLVRKKKSKRFVRAPLQSWDDAVAAITVLDRTISDVDDAEIKYRGKKIKLSEMREAIGTDDGLLLEWDKKGKLKKLYVVSESERWARFRKD